VLIGKVEQKFTAMKCKSEDTMAESRRLSRTTRLHVSNFDVPPRHHHSPFDGDKTIIAVGIRACGRARCGGSMCLHLSCHDTHFVDVKSYWSLLNGRPRHSATASSDGDIKVGDPLVFRSEHHHIKSTCSIRKANMQFTCRSQCVFSLSDLRLRPRPRRR